MSCFVVKIGRMFVGENRHPMPPEGTGKGWRPLIWSKQPIDAEKFSTADDAELWARTWLSHDDFQVVAFGARGPGAVA